VTTEGLRRGGLRRQLSPDNHQQQSAVAWIEALTIWKWRRIDYNDMLEAYCWRGFDVANWSWCARRFHVALSLSRWSSRCRSVSVHRATQTQPVASSYHRLTAKWIRM